MAGIRNDQYLHRPGAGRGAVTPADPMEVMLYGPNGQPISVTSDKLDVRASELEALIGEVQDTPTANTILARLKTLADTLGTETTLQLVKGVLDTISGKVATETTLGSVKSAVESIAGVDFATQTTLAQVLAALTSVKDSDGIKKISDAVTVSGLETLATESTLGDVKTAAETLAGTVSDGVAKVQLSGSLPQPSSPIPVDVKGGGPATYKLVEQRTEADAVGDTLSFSGPIITVEIWNLDTENVGVFVVNGVSITMPPQAHFFAQVGTVLSTDVTVSGANRYIVGRYE